MRKLKFGLCVWNIWGDEIIDRPDNIDETITATMVHWLKANTNIDQIYQFQRLQGQFPRLFQGDHAVLRKKARGAMLDVHDMKIAYPELDYLFVRWRWDLGVENDARLVYQTWALEHYLPTSTRIFIWDDDFTMTTAEREELSGYPNVTFVEISEEARSSNNNHVYLPYPLILDRELATSRVLSRSGTDNGDHIDDNMLVAYVGNNYKREEYIKAYLAETAACHPHRMHMYGNWLKYDNKIREKYPNICFHPKVNKSMCSWIYQHSHVVPMLAKEVYFQRGHITPRLYEAVMSGGIPVGFTEFKNSENYFALKANNAEEFVDIVEYVSRLNKDERLKLLNDQLDMLIENKIFDTEEFFRCLGINKQL